MASWCCDIHQPAPGEGPSTVNLTWDIAIDTSTLNVVESAGTRSVLLSAATMRASGAESTLLDPTTRVQGLDGERALGGSLRAQLGHLTLMARLNTRVKETPTGPFNTVVGAEGTQVQDTRGFFEARYSVLMTGPSATADIKGVLIRGAQGIRTLTVIALAAPGAATIPPRRSP